MKFRTLNRTPKHLQLAFDHKSFKRFAKIILSLAWNSNCCGQGIIIDACLKLTSFSVNAGFIGERGLWNIEIAADSENDKSKINTLYLETSEDQNLASQYIHFNKYVSEFLFGHLT